MTSVDAISGPAAGPAGVGPKISNVNQAPSTSYALDPLYLEWLETCTKDYWNVICDGTYAEKIYNSYYTLKVESTSAKSEAVIMKLITRYGELYRNYSDRFDVFEDAELVWAFAYRVSTR